MMFTAIGANYDTAAAVAAARRPVINPVGTLPELLRLLAAAIRGGALPLFDEFAAGSSKSKRACCKNKE